MDLSTAMTMAASGMKAQSARLRVVAENLANVDSTAQVPGGDPYRRKTISFAERHDRQEAGRPRRREGATAPTRPRSSCATSPATRRPTRNGYVKHPNVNEFVELMDMREARRSYEANLNALELAKSMAQRTIDLLR